MSDRRKFSFIVMTCTMLLLAACASESTTAPPDIPTSEPPMDIFKKPLIPNLYTADPSAHVFDGKIYIYPSHDLDHNNVDSGNGEGATGPENVHRR